MNKIIYTCMLVLIMLINASCQKENNNIIGLKDIEFTDTKANSLLDTIRIKKVIAPESIEQSIIGQVDSVQVSDNGDIYIGDYSSTKRVLRFNKDGDFLTTYGKVGEAPGEFASSLLSFCVVNDKVHLFSCLKVVTFSIEGKAINQRRLDYHIRRAFLFNNSLYLNVPFYRNRDGKYSNLILNKNLEKKGGLGKYDKRLLKYKFLPENNISADGNQICCTSVYDWKYTIYNKKGDIVQSFIEPEANISLNAVWSKSRFTEDDRDLIKKKIIHFGFAYIYKKHLLLLNCCAEKNLYSYWLLNYEKRKAFVIDYHKFDKKNALQLDRIIGVCKDGFIGVVSDPENFNKSKKNHPKLQNLDLSLEDNPLIVIFDIKDNYK